MDSGYPFTRSFELSDRFNDGYRIDCRFFDRANNMVWPSSTRNHYTVRLGGVHQHALACTPVAAAAALLRAPSTRPVIGRLTTFSAEPRLTGFARGI